MSQLLYRALHDSAIKLDAIGANGAKLTAGIENDIRTQHALFEQEEFRLEGDATVFRAPFPRAPLYFMKISRNCTRILSDARAVASASVTAPVFYGKSAKIQWRPTLRYPTARASKAHRPTKLILQNLLN